MRHAGNDSNDMDTQQRAMFGTAGRERLHRLLTRSRGDERTRPDGERLFARCLLWQRQVEADRGQGIAILAGDGRLQGGRVGADALKGTARRTVGQVERREQEMLGVGSRCWS